VPKRRERLKQAGVSSVAELNEHAEELGEEPIPFHVVVIDEFADLIMSVEDESSFEEVVTRLAQIGRALGIVILLATQRPSADIVSGKIKTNFPCRISFRLPSNTDSRVILDEPGAEDLHGAGDMIVKSQSGDQYNLQGYFLTPVDSNRVLSHFQD
jgi:DNA segregation ATPase FtsK/SpoIIIE-like protein